MNYSTIGRPRVITDEHVARILDWQRNRLTKRQLAALLGVCPGTIDKVLRSGGTHFKQPPPDKRAAVLAAARAHRRELQAARFIA